jgi:hypothetical protein
MDQATHNKIVSFIWGVADDVLRDLFKRGKYPDVILPMCAASHGCGARADQASGARHREDAGRSAHPRTARRALRGRRKARTDPLRGLFDLPSTSGRGAALHADAWIREYATKIGSEVSLTRHFYKPQPLRTLEEISADILAIEKEAEGLLDDLLQGAK